ncbi:GNAT family N-acetyltransferase [bacterium SCSIO 12741]|nr:GNAT family N-acetyltransferase [bacterium SCSIO 12741]
MTMIELKPFTESDFETFKSWASSAEELFQFAGPIFTYPLDDEQLGNYLNMADKKPYKVVLTSTQETIGHCELNHENGNNRLSRIVVGKKELRGQKIGEQIVRQMVELLFQNPAIKEVDLNTFDWNKGAIRCYEKVGFRIIPENSDKMNVNGQEWTRINMVLKRSQWET